MFNKRKLLPVLMLAIALAAMRADADTIRFKTVGVKDRDEMIGGEAFTLLVPDNWVVDGGLVWRLHPTEPAGLALRVRNPRGLEQIEFFPALAFVSGEAVSDETAYPVGSNFIGSEVRPEVRDALDCLKQAVVPRFRFTDAPQIVRDEPMPGMDGAGHVRAEYDVSEQPVEEDLYAVLTTTTQPASNATFRVIDHIIGLRAGKGQLSRQLKIFVTIIDSVQPVLPWYTRYERTCRSLTPDCFDPRRAGAELQRIIAATTNDVTGASSESNDQQRQAVETRWRKAWRESTHAVDAYTVPTVAGTIDLPAGYHAAWVSTNREFVVSDRADFDPAVKYGGVWQKLERAAP